MAMLDMMRAESRIEDEKLSETKNIMAKLCNDVQSFPRYRAIDHAGRCAGSQRGSS
jgi:hypothetical protein